MEITDYHAKYFAHELTRRCASDEVDKLAPVLADAQVDLNPHQVEAALFAFQNPLGKGAILADEVGLGKTIEAALLLAQKWAEGKRQLLVILPANLRKQWSQELADKFHLPTAILETRTFNEAIRAGNLNPFAQPAIVLCSFQFARNKAPYITQSGWDLVVVDEAHRLRNVYRATNKIAQAIKQAIAPFPKVLLTATPLQNSLLELFGLVSILDEYTFGDLDSFRDRFVRPGDDDFAELKARLRPLCKRTLRKQVLEYVRYTNRLALVQEFTPFPSEQELYDKVSDYLRADRLYALPASQRQLVTLILRKLLASSTRAIASTLAGLVKKLEDAERAQTAVTAIPDELPENWEPTDELLDEWDGDDSADETPKRLYSPQELAELREELQRLREFLQLANSIDQNSKGEVLLQALRRGFATAAEARNRRFVLVQLPEPLVKPEEEMRTIADITKERVRRVIKNLNDADKGQLRSANEPKPDRGFRVFQLAASNFKPWDGDRSKDAAALQRQLFDHLDHVLPDRSEQDLLYEILLKDGFELTTPIETTTVHGFRVHSIAGGELLLCLQDKLTLDLIKALADKKPSRVVFLDRGFRDNDQLKANAAKLFASKAGDNFKKFKTV